MNDKELELRLREELRRRIAPCDAPDRLFGHVARLGLDESAPTLGTSDRAHRLRRRAGLFGGLAAAAGIAAIIVAGLFWRPDHGPISATSSAVPSPVGPSPTASRSATSVPPNAVWNGLPVTIRFAGRLDAQFGWAAGSAAGQPEALYVTGDGGLTWDQRQVPYLTEAGAVSDLVFTDRDHAFVAASTGKYRAFSNTVLRTSNGGRTWIRAVVDEHSVFGVWELDMLDAERGWLVLEDDVAVVWRLYGTTDGGATWSQLVDSAAVSVAPRQVRFVSGSEGWGEAAKGGINTILHTLDGGKTWAAAVLPLPAGYGSILAQEGAPRASSGKLVLKGSAGQTATSSSTAASSALVTWTSADGGVHWTVDGVEPVGNVRALSDEEGDFAGYEATGDSNENLLLVGPDGQTSSFAGSGIDAFVPSGHRRSLTSARAFSGADAWVTIDACAPPKDYFGSGFAFRPCHRLLATTDGGKTWRPLLWQPSSSGATPTPVVPEVPPCCSMQPVEETQRAREPLTDWLDANYGWAVVGTSLYWTVDGGRTWDAGSALPASGTIQFLDAQHGWLVPSDSSDPGATVYARTPVYRTSDGGRSWTSVDLPSLATEPNWTWAHFADATHGIVGRCPQLIAGQTDVDCEAFTTDDGGLTFQGPVTRTFATPIAWLSPTIGYGILNGNEGAHAVALTLSFDGGRTWTPQKLEAVPGGKDCWASPLAMELTPGGSGRFLLRCWMSSGPNVLARYETADGGQSWHLVWHGPDTHGVKPVVVAPGGGLVGVAQSGVTVDRLWASSDFGTTWKQLAETPVWTHDLAFVDASTGWLVRAPAYSSSPDALLATSDGGRTWRVVLRAPSVVTNP